jgi:uncharacterized membrane protein YedE/YeeE
MIARNADGGHDTGQGRAGLATPVLGPMLRSLRRNAPIAEGSMQQDWIWGLIGGLMIGASAGLYLLANGRILGASGVIGGLIDGSGRDNRSERLWFLAGLVVVPLLVVPLYETVDTHLTHNLLLLIASGLLVGIGTRLANGCTSGHGVCGMSRFSLRGFVATAFYILGGGLALVLGRHVMGVL